MGHQAAIVEGDVNAVGLVQWRALLVLLVSGRVATTQRLPSTTRFTPALN